MRHPVGLGLHRKLTFNEILRCLMIRVPFNQNDVDMDIVFKIYDLQTGHNLPEGH